MSETGRATLSEPISLPISVARLPRGGTPVRFAATPEQCLALAEVLDIPAVDRLEAEVLAAPWRAEGVKVTGRLVADVVQVDVVTLEPVRQRVDEEIAMSFVPEHSRMARLIEPENGEVDLEFEDDIPDVFSGDRIELGAIFREILALGLDPYPRAAQVDFEEFTTRAEPEEAPVSPFAVLRKRDGDR